PNTVEFGGTDVTDSTEDYGLDDPVPNKDIKNAQGTNYDPRDAAAERTALLVRMAREKRVADLYFALGTYAASLRTTLAGTSQWS
ncbi:phage capsid protein, partial [Mycobacterium tuberculosis]